MIRVYLSNSSLPVPVRKRSFSNLSRQLEFRAVVNFYRHFSLPVASIRVSPRLRPILAHSPLFAVFALFLAAGAVPTYRVWQVHEALVAEQLQLQKGLPRKINPFMTLTDVRVSLRDMTWLYDVSLTENDMPALGSSFRKAMCAGDRRTKIDGGATYSVEFRNSARGLTRRFEVASCA